MTRQTLETVERNQLASYASFSAETRGRKHQEDPPALRTEYQRDRDRIVHSSAFRRMEYKTQVFVNHEGDHYRTRLTHSLEVSQIGRSVARALGLNEDLTEALVLAHDIGHTPFGHAGERVMAEIMKDHGGFEHNAQSLRVVETLEHRYPSFPGLNLTFEVREGIAKHSAHWSPDRVPQDLAPKEQPTLEAQLIDLVDEIAYNNHDVDDGLSSQMLDWQSLAEVELWCNSLAQAKKRHPGVERRYLKHLTVSIMIGTLVADLVAESSSILKKAGIQSLADVRKLKEGLIRFSPEVAEMNQELKDFLWDRVYTHYRVIRMEEKAKRILRDLFSAYMDRPAQLPKEFSDRLPEEPEARVICDYIAGMTDRFAIEEHRKLFEPHIRV